MLNFIQLLPRTSEFYYHENIIEKLSPYTRFIPTFLYIHQKRREFVSRKETLTILKFPRF